MSGSSDNPGGPSNEHPTAAERRIAELEAQLRANAEYHQHELEIERTNAERLHQALDSLQTQNRRLRKDQDELTGVSNRRLAEQRRQMLEACQESNADLRRQLDGRSGDATRLEAENRRLTHQVEELHNQVQSTNDQLSMQLSKAATQEEELVKAKETIEECKAEVDEMRRKIRELEDRNEAEESRTADATRAALEEMKQKQQNSEEILNDVLQQHLNLSPISIPEAGLMRLFVSFLRGKHLTTNAQMDEQVATFMRDFDIPAERVEPLRRQLRGEAQRVRNDRHPAQREQQ